MSTLELDPITHEDPAYARGWNDALARDPCAPGEAHRYRIECERCGQVGTLRVSVDPENAPLAETDCGLCGHRSHGEQQCDDTTAGFPPCSCPGEPTSLVKNLGKYGEVWE